MKQKGGEKEVNTTSPLLNLPFTGIVPERCPRGITRLDMVGSARVAVGVSNGDDCSTPNDCDCDCAPPNCETVA